MAQRLTIVLAVLASCCFSGASVAHDLTAAEIIERARAAERWIYEVDSLHLTAESVWTHSDETIAANRIALERTLGKDAVPADHHQLNREARSTLEVAFDSWRFRRTVHGPNPNSVEIRVWDGETSYRGVGPSAEEMIRYDLSSRPAEAHSTLLGLQWPRAGRQNFWFSDPSRPIGNGQRADAFTLVGREVFRGIECYVIQASPMTRLRIGVEDGLLRSVSVRTLPQYLDVSHLAPIAEARGETVRSMQDWGKWNQTLSVEERAAVRVEYWQAVEPLLQLTFESYLDDYEEVAPGCWLPRSQGFVAYDQNAEGDLYESSRQDLCVTQVRINEPLDDALFVIDIPDGVTITDARFEPLVLSYRARKGRTPEELEAIMEEARQSQQQREDAQLIIGSPAPAFPEGMRWHNSEPLTWDDLRGRVVIVTFFANWCGPCRGTYADAMAFYDRRERHGVVVLGIHTPAPTDVVERFVKEFGLEYPIGIDVAGDQHSWGKFYNACQIRGIPRAFLVDAEGTVVAIESHIRNLVHQAERIRPGE